MSTTSLISTTLINFSHSSYEREPKTIHALWKNVITSSIVYTEQKGCSCLSGKGRLERSLLPPQRKPGKEPAKEEPAKIQPAPAPKEKPWYKFWPEGVPRHIDYPEVPLFELLRRTAKEYPDHVSIVYFDKTMTYKRTGPSLGQVCNGTCGT